MPQPRFMQVRLCDSGDGNNKHLHSTGQDRRCSTSHWSLPRNVNLASVNLLTCGLTLSTGASPEVTLFQFQLINRCWMIPVLVALPYRCPATLPYRWRLLTHARTKMWDAPHCHCCRSAAISKSALLRSYPCHGFASARHSLSRTIRHLGALHPTLSSLTGTCFLSRLTSWDGTVILTEQRSRSYMSRRSMPGCAAVPGGTRHGQCGFALLTERPLSTWTILLLLDIYSYSCARIVGILLRECSSALSITMSSESTDPTGLIVDYCAIASTALLWYDFALTFSTEVERIWKRKYTGATFLFIVLRYSSLAESIFFVLASWLWNTSNRVCGVLTHSNDVFTILSDLSAALITILRVYGISVKDWRLLTLVAPVALVNPTLSLIMDVNYYTIQGGPPLGCLYAYSFSNDQFANIVIASVVCGVGANVILIILTWSKTYSLRRDSRELGMVTPLSTLLIKDGTMFFLLLIANILMTYPSIKSSLAIFLVWPFFNRVFTVMILTRFMIDLRGVHLSNPGPGDSSGVQSSNSLVFRALPRITSSTIVGNLAATIRTNGTGSRAGHDTEWGVQEDERLASLDIEPEGEQYSNDPFKAGMSE